MSVSFYGENKIPSDKKMTTKISKKAQSLLGRKCFPIELDFLQGQPEGCAYTYTIMEVSLGANDVPKFKIREYINFLDFDIGDPDGCDGEARVVNADEFCKNWMLL